MPPPVDPDDSMDSGIAGPLANVDTPEGEDADETRVDPRAQQMALDAIRQMNANQMNAGVARPVVVPPPENLVDTVPPPATALSPASPLAPLAPTAALPPLVETVALPPLESGHPLAKPISNNPLHFNATAISPGTAPSRPPVKFPDTRRIPVSPFREPLAQSPAGGPPRPAPSGAPPLAPPPIVPPPVVPTTPQIPEAFDTERELDSSGRPLDGSHLFDDLEQQRRGGTALIDLSRYPGTIWSTPPHHTGPPGAVPPGATPLPHAGPHHAPPVHGPQGGTPHGAPHGGTPHSSSGSHVSRAPVAPQPPPHAQVAPAPSGSSWTYYALVVALVIFIVCMGAAVGYAVLDR